MHTRFFDSVELHYPLASTAVQQRFEPEWSMEYLHEFNSVHVLPGGMLCRLEEDGNKGAGLYVFSDGDWTEESAVFIDTKKAGWSLRLRRLLFTIATDERQRSCDA